jgi:hypothetical protein
MNANPTQTTNITLELKVLGFPQERLPGLALEVLGETVEDFSSLSQTDQNKVLKYVRESKW